MASEPRQGERLRAMALRITRSDQCDLLGLACGQQASVEGLEHGVEARADQGGDVENATHIGAPAEDVTLAPEGARAMASMMFRMLGFALGWA